MSSSPAQSKQSVSTTLDMTKSSETTEIALTTLVVFDDDDEEAGLLSAIAHSELGGRRLSQSTGSTCPKPTPLPAPLDVPESLISSPAPPAGMLKAPESMLVSKWAAADGLFKAPPPRKEKNLLFDEALLAQIAKERQETENSQAVSLETPPRLALASTDSLAATMGKIRGLLTTSQGIKEDKPAKQGLAGSRWVQGNNEASHKSAQQGGMAGSRWAQGNNEASHKAVQQGGLAGSRWAQENNEASHKPAQQGKQRTTATLAASRWA